MTRTAVRITEGLRKAERFPVSRKRKPGQPAHRPIGDNRLTRNERAYYEACLEAWDSISDETIRNQFLFPGQGGVGDIIRADLSLVQPYLGELTLLQLEQSGARMFNEIKTAVAADWARLEKAITDTPSEFATSMRFNRASPNATSYASLSAANMVTDMVDTQVTAVRGVIEQAYRNGLTRGKVSSNLVTLLNEMPSPRKIPAGLAGTATIFGDATRGLTNRYAVAVYHRAEKIMRDHPRMKPHQLKKRVKAYGKRLQRSRARMITRTELSRAANQGRLQGMWQAADQGLVNPVLAKKQWLTSSFDVCEICVPLNGRAIGIRESFGPMGQAPPAHPNCRCTIRSLPDPLTFGIPRSAGTGEFPDEPLHFVRPQKPGLKIEDLRTQPGVVAQPKPLIGQPAAQLADDVPTALAPETVSSVPVPSTSERDIFRAGQAYKDALEEGTEAATEALIRQRGYDARPRVVDFDELGGLVDESPVGEMRRMVSPTQVKDNTGRFVELTAEEMAEGYRAGELFIGEGVYGRGTYTVEGIVDDAAEYFAGRQGARSAHEVLEMTMDSNARIYDMPAEFMHKSRPFGEALHTRIGSDQAHDVLAALGYDAVRYSRGVEQTITVVLNRGKVIVARSRGIQLKDLLSFPKRTGPPISTVGRTGNVSSEIKLYGKHSKRAKQVVDPVLEMMDDAGLVLEPLSTGPTEIQLVGTSRLNGGLKPLAQTAKPKRRRISIDKYQSLADNAETEEEKNNIWDSYFRAKSAAAAAYGIRLDKWIPSGGTWKSRIKIALKNKTATRTIAEQQNTLAHEIGHRIDLVYREQAKHFRTVELVKRIGKDFESQIMAGGIQAVDALDLPQVDRALWRFLQGASNSEALRRARRSILHSMRDTPEAAAKYIKYLASPIELWARAFNQWVVTRHGTAGMKKAMAEAAESWGKQWKQAEFDEEIAPLVEAVLRQHGVIK